MQNTTEGIVKTEQKEKVRLVLNGGGRMLNSATIPVEWHFSSEIIAQKPKFVVICEHEFSLEKFKEDELTRSGRRYVCKVQDLVKYIQLFRPGTHHIVMMVFFGDEAWGNASEYTCKDGRLYEKDVWYNELENMGYLEEKSMYSMAVEFEVSEELFAEKPKDSKWSKFVWDWANRWHGGKDPIDECEYRKRKIFAFTLQIPLFVIGRSIAWFFGTLYILVGSFFTFLFGWKTESVFEMMKPLYGDLSGFSKDLTAFGADSWNWRLWKRSEWDSGKGEYTKAKKIPVFLVPIFAIAELTVVIFLGLALYLLISSFWIVILATAAVIGIVILLYTKVYNSPTNKEKRAAAEKKKLEEVETQNKRTEEELTEFLKNNASLATAGEKVDIDRIRGALTGMNKLKLVFWTVKANVCKPFAK